MKKSKILLPLITLGSIVPCLTVAVSCSKEEKIFETTETKNELAENKVVKTVDKNPITGEEIGVPTYSGDSIAVYANFKYLGEVQQTTTLKEVLDEKYDIQVACTKTDVLMTLYGEFEVTDQQTDNKFNIKVHCSELASRANLDVPAGEYPISLQIIERETQKVVFGDNTLKLQLEAGWATQPFSTDSYFPSMSEVKYEELQHGQGQPVTYRPYITVEFGGFWSFHAGERQLTFKTDVPPRLLKGQVTVEDALEWEEKYNSSTETGKNYWIDSSSNCCGTHSVYCEYYVDVDSPYQKHVNIVAESADDFNLSCQVNVPGEQKNVWSATGPVGVPFASQDLEEYQTHPEEIMPHAFNVLDKEHFGVEMNLHLQPFDLNILSSAIADIECYLSTSTNNAGEALPYIECYKENSRSYTDEGFGFSYDVLGQCQYDKESGEQIATFSEGKTYTITLSIGSRKYCPGVFTPYTFNIKATA